MTRPAAGATRVVAPLLAAVALAGARIPASRLTESRPVERPCEAARLVARQQIGGASGSAADLSADGRIVAFVSLGRLTAADVNTVDDVYTVDRATGAIALESVTASGGAANGSSQQPRLSGDGRILVFTSVAPNLTTAGLEPLGSQVLRRDRATRTTTLVSHTPAGRPGQGGSGLADLSDDGRYIVFESHATDLVTGPDANHGGSDIYLHDAADGTVRRISLTDTGGHSASGQSWTPVISSAGRLVAFTSTAPIDAAARARPDAPVRSVFVRDLVTGATRRLSATGSGDVPDGASFHPTISGDGRRTVFVSVASNLAGVERRTRRPQLYLHERDTGRLRLLTRTASDGVADGSSRSPVLSGDGRFVVFGTDASDLPCAGRCGPFPDLNLVSDVYRLDLATGAVDRVSGGVGAREAWWSASSGGAVDRTGRVVAFSSRQPADDADLDDDDDLYVAVLDAGSDAGGPARVEPCTAPPPRPWPGPR